MKYYLKILVVGLTLAVIAVHSSTLSASPSWMTRSGSIADAVSQPDDTEVYLDAVITDKIKAGENPSYFVCREPWDRSSRIAVAVSPPEELRMGQTVDISGIMGTLPNSERVILQPRVVGYYDSYGNLLLHGPLIKGLIRPIPWQWKEELASATRSRGSEDLYQLDSSPLPAPERCSTIEDAKDKDDGDPIEMECMTVETATSSQMFVMGEDSSSDTLDVYWSGTAATTDRVNRVTGIIRKDENENIWLEVDCGPGYDPQGPTGGLQIFSRGSINWAKTFHDSAVLPYSIDDKVVTRVYPDADCYYIEEPGRGSGIRVYDETFSQSLEPGDVVTVSGTISTDDGERVITASQTSGESGDALGLIGMTNRLLGGGDLNIHSPGVFGGYGLNNLGILVRSWGKVTGIGEDCFFMDDGSGEETDVEGVSGVKVSWSFETSSPPVGPEIGWTVAANGISGAEIPDTRIRRALRVKNQHDLQLIEPEDEYPLTVTITTPPAGEIHIAEGEDTVTLSGMAIDNESKVVLVEAGFGATEPTQWNRAAYDEVTEVWTYELEDVEDTRVWVRATDFAGNVTTVSRDMAISTVSIVYVDADMQNDTGNGLSWETAKKTVQAGIDTAYAMNPKAEVWVRTGQYDLTSTISLSAGVKLYGGFLGDEAFREERNWGKNKTILDGNTNRMVVNVQPGGTMENTVIDGFTIQNGIRGVCCVEGALATISHNVIKGNSYWAAGIGILCRNSSPIIANNWIIDNTATAEGGAGIFLQWSNATVINNTIVNNVASEGEHKGAGIYLYECSGAVVKNNIVTDNSSGIFVYGGNPTIGHNDIWQNTDDTGCVQPTGTNFAADPRFIDAEKEDYRIYWDSECRDAGDDTVTLPDAYDIDGENRRNGTIDVGADETYICNSYALSITSEESYVPNGSPVAVTVYVHDVVNDVPGLDLRVNVSVDAGEIRSITRGGTVVSLPPGTRSTYGMTDADGEVQVVVAREDSGYVNITGRVARCSDTIEKTLTVFFYDIEDMDWPMFMHDPQHTGASRIPDSADETLTREWVVDLPTAATIRDRYWGYWDGQERILHPNPAWQHSDTWTFEHPYIDSSPVVAGNKVVVGTWTRGTKYPFPGEQNPATGSVKAFDAANSGATLWTFPQTGAIGGVASTPCISDGRVYVGSTDGNLYCLDLSTGSHIWTRQTTNRSATPGSSPIISSPVIHDGIVYITNETSKIYAFTADANGTLVAGYPIVLPIDQHEITDVRVQNICGASSPAIATVDGIDYLLVGCDDGHFYRIRLSDRQVQSVDIGACIESSPTVVGDEVFAGVTRYDEINAYRLSIEPLAVIVAKSIRYSQYAEEIRATMAFGHNHFYVGKDTGHSFHRLLPGSLDNASNPFAASGFNPYFVGSAAVTTGGIVYVGNDNGRFYALEADTLAQIVQDGYYDATLGGGFICSSPAIGYNVDANHNRWVFITTRAGGGKLYAFKTTR